MAPIIGMAAFAVAGILFVFATLSNPADGRLVPGGLAAMALGDLLTHLSI